MKSKATTTAIGSLPHHNIDAALAFAFQLGIPFLPQIPIRNPWEYMIAQALEGLPGFIVDRDGSAVLDINIWASRAKAFDDRLRVAFQNEKSPDAFASFEPSAAASSSWLPFLWELEERAIPRAKIQLAGPLTCQWALRIKDGTSLARFPELPTQIFRLVLARAIGMCRRLKEAGVTEPILFLDEPGLYGLSSQNAKHVMALSELKLFIQAIRKEGVRVGLHCCSNTEWGLILSLGLDILSLDTRLSLDTVLKTPESRSFIERGGIFSLGIVPTSLDEGVIPLPEVLIEDVRSSFRTIWKDNPVLSEKALKTALYTPACGLALRSAGDAEAILSTLREAVG